MEVGFAFVQKSSVPNLVEIFGDVQVYCCKVVSPVGFVVEWRRRCRCELHRPRVPLFLWLVSSTENYPLLTDVAPLMNGGGITWWKSQYHELHCFLVFFLLGAGNRLLRSYLRITYTLLWHIQLSQRNSFELVYKSYATDHLLTFPFLYQVTILIKAAEQSEISPDDR